MKRHYEALIQEYLTFFPCIALIGPRQCGKTTLLQTMPETWDLFDLEGTGDFQVIAQDPDLFFRLNPDRVAIDEAQLLPELFPALRVAIDANRGEPGRFIITGSSSPDLLQSLSESLAGRIGIIEMAPFSWLETRETERAPFFDLLLNHAEPASYVEQLTVRHDLRNVHDYWFRGGYPEPWIRNQSRFHEVWMDQYVRTYIHRDLARLFPGLNRNRFQTFLHFLSGLSGTLLNYSDLARSLGVSSPTVREYVDIAHGTFVWRKMPPYEKNVLKRVVKHPRGHLRDSGLLHHLLRIPDLDALVRHPHMGRSWEGMVIEEILRGLHTRGISFDYYFYRTGAGAEVDLIIEGDFGLVPVEIKYHQGVQPRLLRTIRDFMAEHDCQIGFVISNDEKVRRLDERLVGVPFAAL